MISNFVKAVAASAVICAGAVNAHPLRGWRVPVAEPVQYVWVPADPCGVWVELRVDEASGTVAARRFEIHRERTVIRNRGFEIREFPPLPDQQTAPVQDTSVQSPVDNQQNPNLGATEDNNAGEHSIIDMAGELPVVK